MRLELKRLQEDLTTLKAETDREVWALAASAAACPAWRRAGRRVAAPRPAPLHLAPAPRRRWRATTRRRRA
jgi:hypothetical protein